MGPLDVVLGLIDGAFSAGAWRPMLCVLVAAPVAGLAYVVFANRTLASWSTGAILAGGLIAGLIWEWKAGDKK
jgi:hypothetical protein